MLSVVNHDPLADYALLAIITGDLDTLMRTNEPQVTVNFAFYC